MDFQAFDELLVCDESIKNLEVNKIKVGYEFKVRYPSYRGTFLSCIEAVELWVDGENIENKNIYFTLNSKQFLLSELKDLFKEYWFVLDRATITVMNREGLPKGQHEIKMRMKHRIPYTGYFGSYLALDSKCIRMLEVI